MISMMNHFHNHSKDQVAILVATGRPERYRAVTTEWLSRYKVMTHDVWMREDNDARSDHQVKRDMMERLRRIMNIWFVVEDRNSVVKMWRDAGVMCLQPQDGDF